MVEAYIWFPQSSIWNLGHPGCLGSRQYGSGSIYPNQAACVKNRFAVPKLDPTLSPSAIPVCLHPYRSPPELRYPLVQCFALRSPRPSRVLCICAMMTAVAGACTHPSPPLPSLIIMFVTIYPAAATHSSTIPIISHSSCMQDNMV